MPVMITPGRERAGGLGRRAEEDLDARAGAGRRAGHPRARPGSRCPPGGSGRACRPGPRVPGPAGSARAVGPRRPRSRSSGRCSSRWANAGMKSGGMCCTMTMPGAVVGEHREQLLERLDPAGADADDDDPLADPGVSGIRMAREDRRRPCNDGRSSRRAGPRGSADGRPGPRSGCSPAGSATIRPSGWRWSSRAWRSPRRRPSRGP